MNIIQIGTNTGNDHVRDFVSTQSQYNLLILVEPFSIHNDTIKNNYSKINNYTIENVAIDPEAPDGQILQKKLFYADDDGPQSSIPGRNYAVSSLAEEHLFKHGFSPSNLKSINVPCMSINTLFDKYNLSTIDYLFIDAEGYDLEILQSINFDKFNILHIQIEVLHLNKSSLMTFMESKNYHATNNKADYDGYDILFSKKV
jgi:FkbM family methyltransferase